TVDTCAVLDSLVTLALTHGSFAEAARLGSAVDEIREALGLRRWPLDQADHDRAVAAARDALDGEDEAARAQGAAMSLDEVVAYVRRARGERGRPAHGWASLTPTEQQVVDLVVEGLTNPQIAERLFVSRGTVRTHLSHIFPKLGVATRSELAARAARRTG
ncbi:MAG TPA: response regulator transcription factor, partial [Acidimicrobiales bacterium]|nr:response regulator transcription factor [Acidimicrobiales bacterium]